MNDKRRGLYSEEEIKQQDLMAKLKKAFCLIIKLHDEFLNSKIEYQGETKFPVETSSEYYPVEEYFKKRSDKNKESDPTFDLKVFATCEKERIESILNNVRLLSVNSYKYFEEDAYSQALKYIEFLSNIISGLKTEEKQQEKQFASLDELFKDPAELCNCIGALQKVDPPIINEKGEFIGTLKGAIIVWVDVLRQRGKIHKINDELLPELLSKKFPGLTISGSLFRQENFRARDKYRLEFQALIS